MTDATTYLLNLARQIARPYTALPQLRAFMVTGSVAEGEADFYSDLDMTAYYEELPSPEALPAIREQNGGVEPIWQLGNREEGGFIEGYTVNGVECQFGHITLAAWEEQMAQVREKLDVTSPLAKALSGTLICIPLYGETLIQAWQAKIADFPEPLAQAMVKHYLTFFPLWGYQGRLGPRDATLWQYQSLVEAVQNILGVLAGLNRLYYTTFQFKRMARFISQMEHAPADLAPRLDRLFKTDIGTAAGELEKLVEEVVTLVETHMPEIDTGQVRKRLGWRGRPWREE